MTTAAETSPPPFESADAAVSRATVADCALLDFPRIQDPRGNLTFVEGGRHIQHDIKRVYYLYDVPGGAERGGHAHRHTHEVLVAMSGSFEVVVNDGDATRRFHLNRSYYGLYIPALIWRHLENFSSGSVCLVLASERYSEADYHRDYEVYRRSVRGLER